MVLHPAQDIQEMLKDVLAKISMPHIEAKNITCFRSTGASTRAIARICSLPRIYQLALNVKPHYAIEFIAEKFDKQPHDHKIETIIHELLHIPKNFSGALRPHKAHKWSLHREIKEYIKQYESNS